MFYISPWTTPEISQLTACFTSHRRHSIKSNSLVPPSRVFWAKQKSPFIQKDTPFGPNTNLLTKGAAIVWTWRKQHSQPPPLCHITHHSCGHILIKLTRKIRITWSPWSECTSSTVLSYRLSLPSVDWASNLPLIVSPLPLHTHTHLIRPRLEWVHSTQRFPRFSFPSLYLAGLSHPWPWDLIVTVTLHAP